MQSDIHVTTRVLPGGKIEVLIPQLKEGEEVDVVVSPARPQRGGKSLLEFLDSLPDPRHSAEKWQQIERDLQEDRDSWDH